MGIFGQKVLRHGDGIYRIHIQKLLGRLAGIMGSIKRQILKERFIALFGLLEEGFAVIGQHLAPVLSSGPIPAQRLVSR